MKHDTLFIKVDPAFPMPINVQLKEQIKWLITTGLIEPGDTLPPMNQLAAKLNINRNTINWVYTQLRDERLVVTRKGRGTQVADTLEVIELRKQAPLLSIVKQMMNKAARIGFDNDELLMACMTYVQMFSNYATKRPRAILIECREHDHYFYRQQIEQYTGMEVETIFLEDLATGKKKIDESTEYADAIIATLEHADEVRNYLGHGINKLIVIGASPDFDMVLRIARLKEGTKVGFVCLGKTGAQWMVDSIWNAGVRQFIALTEGADDEECLRQLIDQSEYIFASPAMFDYMKEFSPSKVYLIPFSLERGSKKILEDYRAILSESKPQVF